MNIGHKIKELRKQRGITQEQLANSIGISFQAVSKWENNIALPDISLAPMLASYFGVTMDELFEFNLKEIEDDVERIADEAYKFRQSDPEESRKILESGLKKYPENDILLNNLLYVIDYSSNPDLAISVATKLIEKATDHGIKYDALRFLAYSYKAKGDLQSAKSAIEQIPEIYFTRLTEIAYVLNGNAKFEAAEKQKWVSFENLIQMMWHLAECYEEKGEYQSAVQETEKALELIAIIGDSVSDTNYFYEHYVNFFENQIARITEKIQTKTA
ncbi:MAG: helix-turn-helix transcriptional regulator [Clostridia bacterium]|nr:helix-turn-helix transcriptional regulator [Clostridia bacterium]